MNGDDKILSKVEPCWRQAVLEFVETGVADESLLNYIESDSDCQAAIEQLIDDKWREFCDQYAQPAHR